MDFKDKLVLITGGSGYLGKSLVDNLTRQGAIIRVLARNEGNLIKLKLQYPNIQILTGDISDLFDVQQAMSGVQAVFHLAASKHIGIAERQVRECIKSNVIGTLNVLDTSINYEICPECELIVGISTDKAAKVSGVYGASKLLMERLFQQYERINSLCDYRIVRYGNVLYSTGSVLCAWREAMLKNSKITVTELQATRFFWTVDQAIGHIFDCLKDSTNSEPYIPIMRGMSLYNLLKAMYIKYAKLTDWPTFEDYLQGMVTTVGLQPGENLHERLSETGLDSSQVEQYTVNEIISLI